MPGPGDELTTTWIHSDQIPRAPHGHLADREVDVFLEFLFGHLAKRPVKLTLRESAAVARYLERLALQGVRKPVMSSGREHSAEGRSEEERRVRSNVDHLSKVIWGLLRQYGQFGASSSVETARFLKRHSATYFKNLDIRSALNFLQTFELPDGVPYPFNPPGLVSDNMSSSGGGNRYLVDDLTERIYAGYHGLKRAGVRWPGPKVARALDRATVETSKRRQGSHPGWLPQDVNERVKEYDKRLRTKAHGVRKGVAGEKLVSAWRDLVLDKWILEFHRHDA